ncbi:MAG: Xaa-Pro dipeptidase [Steroidobacteraceae bacterium]
MTAPTQLFRTARNREALFRDHVAELRARTDRALAAAAFDGVVIQSGEPLGLARDDQQYPYKAHPYFKWWVPLADAPGSLVHYRPGLRPQLIFFVATDFWYQAAALPEAAWVSEFDVIVVHSSDEARAALPQDLSRTAWLGDALPELSGYGLAAVNPDDLLRRLDYTRARKTPYEVECLAEANRIALSGHAAAADCFSQGGSEYDIHQAFVAACGLREQELPYNAIVALNEAGSVLHYQILQRQPPARHRSLLIDAGASVHGYGSDITRTHAAADADAEFLALLTKMDALQRRLCDLVKPGVDWRDIHQAAVEQIAALLCSSGILRCGVEESLSSGTARLFFPHGIGHLLGLQVHDVGGVMADDQGGMIPKPPLDPALRLTRKLEPGFVVTMEPGLYFVDALLKPARTSDHATRIDWQRVEKLAPYGGIRIEDNLVVTESGVRNLTREHEQTH